MQGSVIMNLPNLEKARIRKKDKTIISRDDYIIPDEVKNIGKGKTYHILTYGCQMNVHDSELIAAIMENMEYRYEADMDKADIIILNT